MLIDLLKKMANRYIKSHREIAQNPEEWLDYLNHFPEPKDYLERSFFQYCCQNKQRGAAFAFFSNFAAFFLIIPYLCRCSICHPQLIHKEKAVFIDDGLTSIIIPKSVQETYGPILDIPFGEAFYISQTDRRYLKSIFIRYPFHFFFLFKNMIKISMYRAILERYQPSAIISYNEFSFTSSMLTDYCQRNHVLNINTMHGEKLFCLTDAFASFHAFYVWDLHYIKLLSDLREDTTQFVLAIPDFLKVQPTGAKCNYDYKYYLSNELPKEMLEIDRYMRRLSEKGYRVCVRPHPRITVMEDVRRYITHVPLERCEEKDSVASISETVGIIAMCSTVHLQGYFMGKELVVDNVSNPERYSSLEKLRYIILNKPHELLSNLLLE